MAKVTNIIKDERPIESAWGEAPYGHNAAIGYEDVTKIVPYHENGEMAPVVWLAVYRGDVVWKRLNAVYVAEICYAP